MSENAPILMPQLGNTMEEGTIVKWLVKEGDAIRPGMVLYEVETDKATIEVEAEVEGVLAKIIVPDGGTVPVKEPVALMAGASSGAVEPAAATPATSVTPATSSRVKASPAARKAAEVLGVDLATVAKGSGPDGRILREDVEACAKTQGDRPTPPPVSAPKPAPVAPAAPTATPIRPRTGEGVRTPMSKMRKAIARNLSISKQTIPHWYTRVTVDAGPMLAYYRREKALYPCSLNDVILEACARVILELPAFRSQVDGDDVVEFDSVNIGLAVGTDQGLTVPVVRNLDGRNLKGIAAESRRVIDNARQGKIEGIGEGVFTISNLGMFGVEEFAAIINPPETAILAVGSVREAVVVKDGAMKAGKVCTMTLSADHRLIDGTLSARFVSRLKEVLEAL